jgi:hypothetical protein
MKSACDGALSFLEAVYSEPTALFPFTTRLVGGEYRPDFQNPRTMRSTVNCLLGLVEAARHRPDHPILARTPDRVLRFLALHENDVVDPGDLGLLAALLAQSGVDGRAAERALARVGALAGDEDRLRGLNVQDLMWLLWGALAACDFGVSGADVVARRLFSALDGHFLRRGDVLPRHLASPWRGGLVSFGASVYYLRSIYLYSKRFQSGKCLEMFRRGVTALLSAQGPQGEWPWLVGCEDGRPLDYYPVFTVHQHSMSMLFLLPALSEGMEGVGPAIARSLAWVGGANQLGRPMVRDDPFFTYRSFERQAVFPRAERFLRARRMLLTGRRAGLAPNGRLTVNTESRSYELGWLLYALAGAPDIAEIG